jgi:polyisoprenoid-binding protein YceI
MRIPHPIVGRTVATAFFVTTMLATCAFAEPEPASRDPAKAPAGVYELDKSHASLTMTLSHMGMSHYTMRFDSFDAHYDYDPANPEAAHVEVNIDADSLDVGEPKLSQRFAREFLDAAHAPKITFVSTSIRRTPAAIAESGGAGIEAPVTGLVTGDLTFRGVTLPVTLQVVFNGTGPGLMGGHRMGFSASGELKRSDFGSHDWAGVVGDDVHLAIEVEFQRK